MDLKEIRKLTRFAQKNGLKRIKSGDFELEFKEPIGLQDQLVHRGLSTRKSGQKGIPIDGLPTEDEMMFWSADENHLESEKDNGRHGL